MGSNMQRQAVPLMVTQRPLVATGMEYKAATDSGVCVLAAHDGTVEYVDADKIIVRCADGSADTYELIKFMRSNQGNATTSAPSSMWARPSRPATCWPTAPRPATARSAWARTL